MKIEEFAKNTNDYELLMLYRENDEDAKNLLFTKYNMIIDIIINKYVKIMNALNMDMLEARSECIITFCDALNNYQDDRNASLPTFLTICIENRLLTLIRLNKSKKNKIARTSCSYDTIDEISKRPFMEILGDLRFEPLFKMIEEEDYDELMSSIENTLSKGERDVFKLMVRGFECSQIALILNKQPKQIYNSIQRIKNKIKGLKVELI